jgi:hypothetical protein
MHGRYCSQITPTNFRTFTGSLLAIVAIAGSTSNKLINDESVNESPRNFHDDVVFIISQRVHDGL